MTIPPPPEGLKWTSIGLVLCFLLCRLFARLHAFRRLCSDDFIIIAAWTMKLGTSILWQINERLAVLAVKKPLDLDFVNRDTALWSTSAVFAILFYLTVWLVKFSFLMFFRRLGSKAIGLNIWWWYILVVTVCIADIQYRCALGSDATIIGEFSTTCSGTDLSMNAERRSR